MPIWMKQTTYTGIGLISLASSMQTHSETIRKTLIHVHCFCYFVHFLFLKGMNFNWYKTLSEDNTCRSKGTTIISTNTMHIVSYSMSKEQPSHIKTRLSSYTSFSHHDPLRHCYFCAVLRVFTLKRRLRRQWGGIFSSK